MGSNLASAPPEDAGSDERQPLKILINARYGLGNQLLQYVAGLYFAEKYGASLEILVRPEGLVSWGHPRPFLLPKFLISTPYRTANFFERKVLRAKAAPLWSALGIEIQHVPVTQGFQEEISFAPKTDSLYLNGWFLTYHYAALVEGRLRNELRFREAPTGHNLASLKRIRDCRCAVSLHIRRGDYTKHWSGKNVLPMAYYQRAIALIREAHSDPTFFVFSDDIPFARENLPGAERFVFIDHNDEKSAVEDLRLMSCCRHHIIANSTFSWWGAWLNPNPDKDVVTPDRWFESSKSQAELIAPTWRRVCAWSQSALDNPED